MTKAQREAWVRELWPTWDAETRARFADRIDFAIEYYTSDEMMDLENAQPTA